MQLCYCSYKVDICVYVCATVILITTLVAHSERSHEALWSDRRSLWPGESWVIWGTEGNSSLTVMLLLVESIHMGASVLCDCDHDFDFLQKEAGKLQAQMKEVSGQSQWVIYGTEGNSSRAISLLLLQSRQVCVCVCVRESARHVILITTLTAPAERSDEALWSDRRSLWPEGSQLWSCCQCYTVYTVMCCIGHHP